MEKRDEYEFHARVGARVHTARVGRALVAEQVAAGAGISLDTLTAVEQGRRRVDTILLRALARALDCSTEELLYDPPAMKAIVCGADADSPQTAVMIAWARELQRNLAFVEREQQRLAS